MNKDLELKSCRCSRNQISTFILQILQLHFNEFLMIFQNLFDDSDDFFFKLRPNYYHETRKKMFHSYVIISFQLWTDIVNNNGTITSDHFECWWIIMTYTEIMYMKINEFLRNIHLCYCIIKVEFNLNWKKEKKRSL